MAKSLDQLSTETDDLKLRADKADANHSKVKAGLKAWMDYQNPAPTDTRPLNERYQALDTAIKNLDTP